MVGQVSIYNNHTYTVTMAPSADFLKPPSGSVSCQISLQSNAQLVNSSYERPLEWWELTCAHDFSHLSNTSLDLYIYSERIALSVFSAIASIG